MSPFTVIIPARYASSRLPGKPLADIGGKPMLQWVWERAQRAGADEVVIATDDARIADVAADFGARALMTAPEHATGTDRLAEAARQLELSGDAIVINVQGDEPLIPPAVIGQVATNLAENPEASIATLSSPVLDASEAADPNAVKVVADSRGLALYFSRALVPWPREAQGLPEKADTPPGFHWQRHIGLYAYRVAFLEQFPALPVPAAEQLEQLEQLRALHAGFRIHVAEACEPVPGGVDTEADLQAVRERLAG